MTPYTYRNRTVPSVPVLANPYVRGTSEWWIWRLAYSMDLRRERLRVLDSYYRGTNDTFGLASMAAVASGIATLFRGINANLAKLIVDAPRQRLEVWGFRTGSNEGDELLDRVWAANEMDGQADTAHREALVLRSCPVLVEPPDASGLPRITPQDPQGCYVETAPGDARLVRAALKRWQDDDGRWMLTLYLPDRIERWQAVRSGSGLIESTVRGLLGMVPREFEPRTLERGEQFSQKNPLGEVPFAVITNGHRASGTDEAEHETVLPLLDLYNKTLLDMATTSEFGAFPQRYGIGVDLDEGEQVEPGSDAESVLVIDASGQRVLTQPLARFRAAVDSMITTPAPDAQFGQFAAADLTNYVAALDQIRSNIGTITFTPYHLLLNMPTAVPATGEALRGAEVGLVKKVRDHHREKGAGWRRVARLVLRYMGETDLANGPIEPIWAPPETVSEAQHADALTKLVPALGLPQQAAWELIPLPPAQIRRWQRLLDEQGPMVAPAQPGRPGQQPPSTAAPPPQPPPDFG